MPSVLVPLAPGFEELEAITIVDLLRRAKVEVVTAGLVAGPITASRGSIIVPDTMLDQALGREFDMVVLPGGQPGSNNLEKDSRIISLLKKMSAEGKHTAAICAAPRILATAGVLDDKDATGYPGTLKPGDFPAVNVVERPIVIAGKVITSRGPGTAMDFALTLIETLCGKSVRDGVEAGLVRPKEHIGIHL